MAMKLGRAGKQKSRQAALKRFRKSNGGKGKVMRTKAGVRHLLMQKSTVQKKKGRNGLVMAKGDAQTVAAMIPGM